MSNNRGRRLARQLNILSYVASRYPARVGATEIPDLPNITPVSLRQTQRTLNQLVELGFINRDMTNPVGYQAIPSAFSDFQFEVTA